MGNLSEKLKLARLELGLTLMELSAISGVNKNTIHRMESDISRHPKASNIHKLAKALGIDITELGLPPSVMARMANLERLDVATTATPKGHGISDAGAAALSKSAREKTKALPSLINTLSNEFDDLIIGRKAMRHLIAELVAIIEKNDPNASEIASVKTAKMLLKPFGD